MLSDDKVIEIFYMADDFCNFLMNLIITNPEGRYTTSRRSVSLHTCQTITDHHTSPVGTTDYVASTAL